MTTTYINAMTSERGLEPVVLDNVHHVNRRNDTPTTFTMSTWSTRTETQSWTESTSDKWHAGTKAEYKAKVGFIVAESEFTAGADFFWETSKESSTNTGFSTERRLSYGIDTEVAPGKGVHCRSYAVEGKADLTWKGFAIIKFQGGGELNFVAAGQFESVSYSKQISYFIHFLITLVAPFRFVRFETCPTLSLHLSSRLRIAVTNSGCCS